MSSLSLKEKNRGTKFVVPRCPNCGGPLVQHCLVDGNINCDMWKCPRFGGFGWPEGRWVPDVKVGEPV